MIILCGMPFLRNDLWNPVHVFPLPSSAKDEVIFVIFSFENITPVFVSIGKHGRLCLTLDAPKYIIATLRALI